jgi:O-antigen/teichoic acid export membrane protein
VSFAAPATVVAAADQLLVNGGPLLVIAGGASRAGAAAGLVFAATMLVRAPIYVFQGFAAALLPNLTHLAATGGRKELRRAVVRIAGAFAVVGAVLVPAAAVGGPAIMRAVYGGEYDADARSLMLLTASVAFYLAAGTFSQALLALGKTFGAAAGWTLAAVSFVGAYAAIPGAPLTRVAAALALGCLIGAIALATSLLRSSG